MLDWDGCWDGIDAVIEWIGMDAGLGCDGCLAGMNVGLVWMLGLMLDWDVMGAVLGCDGCCTGME